MSARRSPPPQAIKEALERLPASAWTLYETKDDYRRYYTMIDIGGVMTRAEKTEPLFDEFMQEINRHQYEESLTQRFGDGRVVGRIPMNKFFGDSELSKRMSDRDHLKWWLNKDENRPFRTFRGKI